MYGERRAAYAADLTPKPVTMSLITMGYQSENMEANGESAEPAISADGRYVAFISNASNLISEATALNVRLEHKQVYLNDRKTGLTELVSVAVGSEGIPSNGDNGKVSISDDGRYVAFESKASNLVVGDLNSSSDVFVWDRETRVTRRLSVSDAGAEAAGHSKNPSISANGQMILFESEDTALDTDGNSGAGTPVYRANLSGEVVRMQQPALYSTSSFMLSGDGLYTVFEGEESLYKYDFSRNETKLLLQASSTSTYHSPAISHDGKYVAFRESKWVDNQYDSALIKVMDTTMVDQNVTIIGPADNYNDQLSMSPDGRYISFVASTSSYPGLAPENTFDGSTDLYVWDRQTSAVTMASDDSTRSRIAHPSVNNNGTVAFDDSYNIKVSYASSTTIGWNDGASPTFNSISNEPSLGWPDPASIQLEGFHIYKEVVTYTNTTSTFLGSVDASTRSFSLAGEELKEGDRLKVYAINRAYNSSALPLIGNFHITDTEAPSWMGGNTGFRVSYIQANSARLDWNAAIDNSGSVASYKIWRIVDGGRSLFKETSHTTIQLEGLQPGTSYTLVIQAGDKPEGNWSSDSEPITFQTLAENAETGVLTAQFAEGKVTLGWSASQHAAGAEAYRILRVAPGEAGIQLAAVGPAVTEFIDTTVSASRPYYYQIKGYNLNNVIVYQTNLVEISTGTTAPPVISYTTASTGEQLARSSTFALTAQAMTGHNVTAVIRYETWLDEAGRKRAYPRQVETSVSLAELSDPVGTYTGNWQLPEGASAVVSLQPVIMLNPASKVWGTLQPINKQVAASVEVSFNLAHLEQVYREQLKEGLTSAAANLAVQVEGQVSPVELPFVDFGEAYIFNELPSGGIASVSMGAFFSTQQTKLLPGLLNRIVLSNVQINPTLTVSVKDIHNKPLRNMEVKFLDHAGDERFRGRTNENGEVATSRLPIGSGTVSVGVEGTRLIPQQARAVEIAITPVQESFVMQEIGKLTLLGTIMDSFGVPIPGVQVGVSQTINNDYTFSTGVSGTDGRYTVNAYPGVAEVMLSHQGEVLSFPEKATINLVNAETNYSPEVNRFEEGYVFLKLYYKRLDGRIEGPYKLEPENLSKWEISLKDAYGKHDTYSQYPIRTWGVAGDEIELCLESFENQEAGCRKVRTDQDNSALIEWTIEEQSRVEARFVEGGALYQLSDLQFRLERWQAGTQQWAYFKLFTGNPLSISLPAGKYRYDVSSYNGVSTSGEFETRLGDLLNLGDIPLLQTGKLAGKPGNGLITSAGQVLPGEAVTMRGTFRNTDSTVSEARLVIDIPAGTALVAGSINVQYSEPTQITEEGSQAIVHLGVLPLNKEGTVLYKLKVDESYSLPELEAKLRLAWSGGEEIIGRTSIPTTLISLVAPATVYDDYVRLDGRAPGGSTVTFYDGETVIGQTIAYPGGYWSKEVRLADLGQPSRHELRAEAQLAGKQVVTPKHALMYAPEEVRLKELVMKQFNGKEIIIQPENGVARFPFTINPYAPTSFAVYFSDPELIEVARVRFTDEPIELEKDESGVFRADIVPGYKAGAVYIEYKTKRKVEVRLPSDNLKAKLPPLLRNFDEAAEPMPSNPSTGSLGGARFELGSYNVVAETFILPDDGYQLTDEEALAVAENRAPKAFGPQLNWKIDGTKLIMEISYYEEMNEPLVSKANKGNVQVLSLSKAFKKIKQKIEMNLRDPGKLDKMRKKAEEMNDTIEEGEGVIDTIRSSFDATIDFSDRMNRLTALAGLAAMCPPTNDRWNPFILKAIDDIAALSAITMVMSVADYLNPIPFDEIGLDPIGSAVDFIQEKAMDDRIKGLEDAVKFSNLHKCDIGDTNPGGSSSNGGNGGGSGDSGSGSGSGGSGWGGGMAASPVYIYDPSGYIYEAVTDNRITDATVTLFELHNNAWAQWDAAWFGLTNPQITDTEGKYGWDVPFGTWQVVVSKDGYLPAKSAELVVPPQHFDVNIPIVTLEPPTVQSIQAWTEAGAGSSEVRVNFSRYIEADQIGNGSVVVSGSNGVVEGYVEPLNVKKDEQNKDLVQAIRFVPNMPMPAGELLTVFVDASSVTSYAGIAMAGDEQHSVSVLLKDTSGPELVAAALGSNGREIRLTFNEAVGLLSSSHVAGITVEGTKAVPSALVTDASKPDGRTVKLILSQSIGPGEQVSVTMPAGQFQDRLQNGSLAVTKRPVSNTLPSSNARLLALDVFQDGRKLQMAFDPGKNSYTINATVGTAITIGATAAETKSRISIADKAYNGIPLPILSGQNETDIPIIVTAPDGRTSSYYSLTINRVPAVIVPDAPPATGVETSSNGNTIELQIPKGEAKAIKWGEEITVSVPSGAFDQAVRIRVERVTPNSAYPNEESLKLVSSIFEITRSVDAPFNKPITITLQLAAEPIPGQIAGIYFFDEKASNWIKVGGTVKDRSIRVQVNHFTKFAVFTYEPAAFLSDVRGHWGLHAIAASIDRGIVDGYP
ncbi:MAG: hypothetical protein K0R67_1160, partial [Paenibacillus sp.]|nr:hypothetical protein [Paenibacillus sp.]